MINDEEDKDEVFGVTSVINLTSRKVRFHFLSNDLVNPLAADGMITRHVHWNVSLFIVCTQKWLHKFLVNKKSIISPTYLSCLQFSLISRNILIYCSTIFIVISILIAL